MNDSSTGGYLLPLDSPPPPDDQALVVAFQNMVVGITGMTPNLVRPRWQSIPPKQPEFTVDWCAVGVTEIESDVMDSQVHVGAVYSNLLMPVGSLAPMAMTPVGGGQMGTNFQLYGYTEAIENERLRVTVSFYGPNCQANAKLLRGGIKIGQNREALYFLNAGLNDISGLRFVPELVNEQWIPRMDFDLVISRAITRTFDILDLFSAGVNIEATDSAGAHLITEPFTVHP